MSAENRAQTMAVKLGHFARRAGVATGAVVAAYEMSVARRLEVLHDVFHPDLLHPARTALILLEDAGCTDEALLTAAPLCESEYPELRIGEGETRRAFGSRVADILTAVPLPAGNELLVEELVQLPGDVALLAIAERLDHARHLKFRDPSVWRPFYEQITAVYLPFSARISPRLQGRLSRWTGAFEKQLLAMP